MKLDTNELKEKLQTNIVKHFSNTFKVLQNGDFEFSEDASVVEWIEEHLNFHSLGVAVFPCDDSGLLASEYAVPVLGLNEVLNDYHNALMHMISDMLGSLEHI